VETCDHYKGGDFDAEEETVSEFMQTCTMHISENHRELVRVLLQTEDSSFNFFAEARPKAWMPCLVPILSLQKFGSRPVA
jgi:hypothetical protein